MRTAGRALVAAALPLVLMACNSGSVVYRPIDLGIANDTTLTVTLFVN